MSKANNADSDDDNDGRCSGEHSRRIVKGRAGLGKKRGAQNGALEPKAKKQRTTDDAETTATRRRVASQPDKGGNDSFVEWS